MRLFRETYHLFVDGRKSAAAQIELTLTETQDGDFEITAAKVFGMEYGSFTLAGVTELQRCEYFSSEAIQRQSGNVIQFPTPAQKGDVHA